MGRQKRKYKKSESTIAQDWKARLEKETGIDVSKTEFASWTWDKMEYIFRKQWWEILAHAKENDLEVRNIVAVMGKDTRKTTVWVIFLWFLMTQYEWLNGFMLRDTILKAQTQMKMQLRKAVNLITNEYSVECFNEKVSESNDGFYLVRDKKAKDNQKIELLSFDSIVELGGFTTNNGYPALFIYDELQNPHSSTKDIISQKKFLANYKFIEKKNKGIEMSSGKILPKWIPRHLFLSNRYVGHHPLNKFIEDHMPYFDKQDEEGNVEYGVRSWMLRDPLKNNFIAKYFGKEDVKPGWEDFWGTIIVQGGVLSNSLMRMDKEWEAEQIKLIKRGNPEDLAYIIGDLYEGDEDNEKAYHYSRKDTITREVFEKDYAPYVRSTTIAIDLDFSRQIRIRPKYNCEKQKTPETKIFRTIREKAHFIKCHGVSDDGINTETYFRQTHNKLIEISKYINKTMPHIKKIFLIFDDKKAQWVGRFNIGDAKSPFWSALKVNFDQKWRIYKRPQVIDEMQDTGFIIDIEDYSNTMFHLNTKVINIKKGKSPKTREEKDNDPFIDDLNTDEYGLYNQIPRHKVNLRATRLLGGENKW